MIDWVDARLVYWGAWARGDLDTGYGESPIARLMRGNIQQPLSSQRMLVTNTHDEALVIDQAIAQLDKQLQVWCRCWYLAGLPSGVIAKRMRVSRSTVYRYRDMVHAYLGEYLEKKGKNHYI